MAGGPKPIRASVPVVGGRTQTDTRFGSGRRGEDPNRYALRFWSCGEDPNRYAHRFKSCREDPNRYALRFGSWREDPT